MCPRAEVRGLVSAGERHCDGDKNPVKHAGGRLTATPPCNPISPGKGVNADCATEVAWGKITKNCSTALW